MLVTSVSGLFCISVSAGALGGALGMASGIFIVPILTIIAGVDVRVAIGASLVSVIACSSGSAAPFLKQRLTNVRLAIVLETATTLGAASGVLLSGVVPVPALYAIFATVLLVSAWQMLMRRRVTAASPPGRPTRRWVHRLDFAYPDRAIALSGKPPTGGPRVDIWRRPAVRASWDRQRCPQNPSDGHCASLTNQGLVGDVELHDRGDGRGECRRLLHARRDCAGDRGPRRLGLSCRSDSRRAC